MVALIIDKMQNTAIRIRLFFVSEVSMVCAVRTVSISYIEHTFLCLTEKIDYDARVDENDDTNLKNGQIKNPNM